MLCNDKNCDLAVFQRGYCQRHYMQFYRHGDDYDKLPPCGQCGGPTGGKSRLKKFCDSCAKERIRGDRRRANNRRRSKFGDGDHYTIQMLLDSDGSTCYLCRVNIEGKPSIDHVLALSLGGTDTFNNVALTHWECNNRKKAKSLGEAHLDFPHMQVPERMEISYDPVGHCSN